MRKTPTPASVLIVDDMPMNISLLNAALTSDYTIRAATSGKQAIDICLSMPIDIILLDVMMPGLSGLEVLSTIREHKDKKVNQVPIMMITAKSTIDDIDAAVELGASSYIVKPFRPANLAEKVQAIFDGEIAD